MNRRIFLILFSLVLFAAGPVLATDAEASPFRSVVVTRGAVVATLSQGQRWRIQEGSGKVRLSEPGESFTLQAGASLRLVERHTSDVVTACLTAPAGLQIESTFDTRSVGGELSKRSYYLPAFP